MKCPKCGTTNVTSDAAICPNCACDFESNTLIADAPLSSVTGKRGGCLFCRNCGKEVAEQAVMCVGCGMSPQNGKNFCQNCGAGTNPAAEVCVKCGVRLASMTSSPEGGKDWLTTLLLAIFLGGLGIHRFYTGLTGTAIIQLLTLGGCGIWALIDIILIAAGSFKDKNGNLLRRN